MLLYDERTRAEGPGRGELGQRVEKLLEHVLSIQPDNATASRLLTALKAG
jgi:hypothetical protein